MSVGNWLSLRHSHEPRNRAVTYVIASADLRKCLLSLLAWIPAASRLLTLMFGELRLAAELHAFGALMRHQVHVLQYLRLARRTLSLWP